MSDARQKFQQKLKELFQFEAADLDFGIYRIMNYRRAAIERFIEKDLPEAVGKALASGASAGQEKAVEELAKLRDQLLAADDQAVDADGALSPDWLGKKLGKEYLAIQARLGGLRGKTANEALVFNHLYTFFSRYYDAGDFLSLRRYSRKERYAIPYNGEEVHLHWANSDQYFIKTGENFTDYAFRAGAVTVRFKLRNAETEQDNRKAEKRFFLPQAGDAACDAKARIVTIPFEYRQLTDQEAISYGKKNQQDAILAAALEAIPKKLKGEPAVLAALMAERRKTGDGEPVSTLAHHLRSYTRRNTMDYFIHKNLRGFLERELDFYLKNEVLNLDEVAAGGEALGEGWFQVMRAIRAIGTRIIAFLAQIEDFQKRLFEKRKFVAATHYGVTLAAVPETLHAEIAANEAQWREWKDLLHIDEEAGDKDLFTPKSKKARRLKFLKEHPTLVLDTRHFDASFTDDLLASFDDLDEATDGLLFHAENLQALNLMQEKFREKVKCIYIDPPYNTGSDGFPYKDGYQDSSWLAMIRDRIGCCHGMLAPAGAFFSSIDDTELFCFKLVLDTLFSHHNFLCGMAWEKRYSPPNDTKDIGYVHEMILAYRKSEHFQRNLLPLTDDQRDRYKNMDNDPRGPWKPMDYTCRYTAEERPNLYYAIRHPVTGNEVWPKKSRVWAFSKEAHEQNENEDRLWWGKDGSATAPALKNFLSEIAQGFMPVSLFKSDQVGHTDEAAKELRELFPEVKHTPKPVRLVSRMLQIAGDERCHNLDFFAGSGPTGHATISLNRTTGGSRKFVLVELADYFETVLLPRLKKVIFTPEWKDGKPARLATKQEAERSPRVIKYHRLESYEDALNNIRLDDAAGQAALRFDDYLLHYMLDWESKDCETFLNVRKLAAPFDYKLVLTQGQETREQAVDLPETFAYLIGLHIETRRVHLDKGRRYLVQRGRCGTRKTAVIWRDTSDWADADWRRDAEFVAKAKLAEGADDIYVNTDSHIPGARSLDPVFKQRMFAEGRGKENS